MMNLLLNCVERGRNQKQIWEIQNESMINNQSLIVNNEEPMINNQGLIVKRNKSF